MIVSFLVFVVIVLLAVPSAIVLFPFTLLSGNVGPLYAVGCFIARLAIRVAGIRIQIQGQEKIPAGRACIFMANHVSNLDRARPHPQSPRPHFSLPQTLAHEASHPRLRLQARRIHSR